MLTINIKFAGLLVGAFWGILVFAIGMYSAITRKPLKFIELASSLYFGYKATLKGSLVGAFWGFLDGFCCGVIFSWIFNFFVR